MYFMAVLFSLSEHSLAVNDNYQNKIYRRFGNMLEGKNFVEIFLYVGIKEFKIDTKIKYELSLILSSPFPLSSFLPWF